MFWVEFFVGTLLKNGLYKVRWCFSIAHSTSPEVASQREQSGPDGASGERADYPSPVASVVRGVGSPESPDDSILGMQLMSYFDEVSSDMDSTSPAHVGMDPYGASVESPKCRNGIASPLGTSADLQV